MTNKEKQFFEKVYYKCNIEPLFEQILRESPIMPFEGMVDSTNAVLKDIRIKTKGLLKNLPEDELHKLDKEIEKIFIKIIERNNAIKSPFALAINTNGKPSILAANPVHYEELYKRYSGYKIVLAYDDQNHINTDLIGRWFDLVIGELRPKEGQKGFSIINRYYQILRRAFIDVYKNLPDFQKSF